MDFTQNIILSQCSILDALRQMNSINRGDALTLFVVDNNMTVLGTVTDGDIRRAIIRGSKLDDCIENVSNKNFRYLRENEIEVDKIREYKNQVISLLPVVNEDMVIIDVADLKKYKSYLPIDAVLMAGGKGERLRPLTEKTPKPLLPMNGRPIIDYIVEHILSFGIKNVSVTVNYLKEQIEKHFAEPFQGIYVKTVREPKYLGTIGSLQYMKEFKNDTVLLMNSDAITDINLEDFYLHFKQHKADMSVAAIPYNVSIPYGIFQLDGRNIRGVLEKPTYNYFANAGIYLIKRKLLDLIPTGDFFNATDFMELLIAKDYNVIRFPLNGTWIDIGNPQEYQKAMELMKHIK